jgi:hypothetical protein
MLRAKKPEFYALVGALVCFAMNELMALGIIAPPGEGG